MIQFGPGLYRGPQLSAAQFSQLEAFAIDVVIDLEPISPDPDAGIDLPSGRHVEVKKFPMCPVLPPMTGTLDRVLEALAIAHGQNQRVYVHCRTGVDRTGIVCLCWHVIYGGWGQERAILDAKAQGMHWWLYWWLYYVPYYIRSYDLGD